MGENCVFLQETGLRSPLPNPSQDPLRFTLDLVTPHTSGHPKRPREDPIPTPRDDQDSDRDDGEMENFCQIRKK